jgi:hypothetical protein
MASPGIGVWILLSYLLALILFDAGCRTGVIGGVIRVSPDCSSRFSVLSSQWDSTAVRFGGEERLHHRGTEAHREHTEECQAKKCGAESGDPNLRFQPRLPGSVVGEASMGQVWEADKITGVTVLR